MDTQPVSQRKLSSVELFAGAGGLAIGSAKCGFVPKAVVEWDKYCCQTIAENQIRNHSLVRDWPVHQGDVRDFSFDNVGPVDLVSGGPPCQPFSIGGRHRAYDDARDMFPAAVRAVRELAPKAFVFENVRGLTRTSFRNYFEYIRLQLMYPELVKTSGQLWSDHLAELESHYLTGSESGLHYRLVTRVLNAADYGVPQKRFRVFFVGVRSDLNLEYAFPKPTHSSDSLERSKGGGVYWQRHDLPVPTGSKPSTGFSLFEETELLPWRTVRDVISDLPSPYSNSPTIWNHTIQPGARSYAGHTGSVLDEPAKTLKAGAHGVPGGENMVVQDDGSVRYFTIRECARLQTFPDDYVFPGSWTEAMRQLGNAVPVTLAEKVLNGVRSLVSV